MIALWLSEEEFLMLAFCVDRTLHLGLTDADAEDMAERGRAGIVGMVEKMTVELHRLVDDDDA